MDTKKNNKCKLEPLEISILICVSEDDLLYLFNIVLLSCFKNINFSNHIYIVTPTPEQISKNLHILASKYNKEITVIEDTEVLSKEEQELCGWSRQQIIKLRSYMFCDGDYVMSVGADTIILKELSLSDFYNDNKTVIHYRKHNILDKHYLYERNRVKFVCRIFDSECENDDNIFRDYIFDVFLFECDILRKLEKYIKEQKKSCYTNLFPKKIRNFYDMGKIGEWVLYCVFVIKILELDCVFQDGTHIVRQIHSKHELDIYDYSDMATHFVRSDFDKNLIIRCVKKVL